MRSPAPKLKGQDGVPAYYAICCRRMMPTVPINPVPTRATIPGSGMLLERFLTSGESVGAVWVLSWPDATAAERSTVNINVATAVNTRESSARA